MNDPASSTETASAAETQGRTRRLMPDEAGLDAAARLLRAGGLVAFPTETVYGLGADATLPAAVAGIYAAKGRPRFNPLIAHVPTLDAAMALGRFNGAALALARAFWPGPLTLVVPLAPDCPVADLALAGHDSIAVRVPNHPVALRLLALTGHPVVAPSANRSGHVSPTDAQHVIADLDSRIDAVVDGGPTQVGVESTIVACLEDPLGLPLPPVLLRPGGVARSAIEAVLGAPLGLTAAGSAHQGDGAAPLSPGMLASHYAPRARLRLGANHVEAGEAALTFGPAVPAGLDAAVAHLSLSPGGDLTEAAANLFGALRRLDQIGAAMIAVSPVPETGLGEAINDRLRRAAAGR